MHCIISLTLIFSIKIIINNIGLLFFSIIFLLKEINIFFDYFLL